MNFKQVLKIIFFMLILGVIVYFLCDIFEIKNGYMSKGYASYKNFEEDTIDAVFIGTSGVNRSWIAVEAFDLYGMTVATLSTDALPCWITLDMIKEAYKYQNPKLVILDMRMFTKYDPSKYPELSMTRARRAIDTLDFFSWNRIDAINRTLELGSTYDIGISRFDPSFFFSFIQYHEMWSEDDFEIFSEIGSPTATYLGFYVNKKKSIYVEPQKKSKWTDEYLEIAPIAIECLDEILEYCDENNIELLFVDTPHTLSSSDSKRNNEFCRLLDERNQKYVLFTDPEYVYTAEDADDPEAKENKINRKKHYYDVNHLNFYGAEIFTRIFAEYLKENYDLPDHTGDERCPEWVGKYTKLKKLMATYKKQKKEKEENKKNS